jgi:hypothetical protein
MGILNNTLGLNLTDQNPLITSPYAADEVLEYIVPPPPSQYMITEDGLFMQTETGNNLMITE